jgi:hypothetical protein
MAKPPRPGMKPCAKGRAPKPTRDLMRYAGDHITVEPFCSTDCCRAWYDNPRGPTPSTGADMN